VVGFGGSGAMARGARAGRGSLTGRGGRRPATERELNATRADLATLLRESDFVTLHTLLIPSRPAT
jgi:lactate dehydrogenase-like 2-hydroxyacid dehydrogenase